MSIAKYPHVFTPMKIGKLTLKNRIFAAPTSLNWISIDGELTLDTIAFYEMKAKGGAVVGINTDTLDGGEDAIAEAKSILSEKGASYSNIYFAWDSDAGNLVSQIFSYPTSILVDRNGNIIGDPIVGGINNPDVLEEVNSRIDQILAGDQGA